MWKIDSKLLFKHLQAYDCSVMKMKSENVFLSKVKNTYKQ